jgi:hypothetical protein
MEAAQEARRILASTLPVIAQLRQTAQEVDEMIAFERAVTELRQTASMIAGNASDTPVHELERTIAHTLARANLPEARAEIVHRHRHRHRHLTNNMYYHNGRHWINTDHHTCARCSPSNPEVFRKRMEELFWGLEGVYQQCVVMLIRDHSMLSSASVTHINGR